MLWHLTLVFERVATVEELAYVATDVVLECKVASWMLVHEPRDIKDKIVKDHELLSFLQQSLKVFKSNSVIRVASERLLFAQAQLMSVLK